MISNQILLRLILLFIVFLCVVLVVQFRHFSPLIQRFGIYRRGEIWQSEVLRKNTTIWSYGPLILHFNNVSKVVNSEKKSETANEYNGGGNVEYDNLEYIYPKKSRNNSIYGDRNCPGNKYRNILAKLFERWKALAKRENVDYLLTCGTLLGSYRNGDLIPYDNDMDVLINREDFPKIRKYHSKRKFIGNEREIFIFVNRDFYLPYEKRRRFSCTGKRVPSYMDHCSFQEPLGRLITENRHLDIYDYQRNGTLLWDPSEGGRIFHQNEVFPLKRCYLMGYETTCPNKPKEFLEKFYGMNLDPSVICKNGVWSRKSLQDG